MNSLTLAASFVSTGFKRLRDLSARMVKKVEKNNPKPKKNAPPPVPEPPNLLVPPDGPPEIVVLGSANIDYITYVNELPKAGESMSAMFREKCYGGKAANQCVAARKLGAGCALIAKLGNDDLGKEYHKYLSDMLIHTEFLQLVEGELTGLTQINVDDRSANTIVVLFGANRKLIPKDVKDYKKLFKTAKVMLCQLESDPKAVLSALNMFKGISVLNASPVTNTTITKELIAAPSILCVNEIEAAQLTEREQVSTVYEAKAAANDLLLKGAKSVIITLGDQGAIHLSKKEQDRCIHCPAAPVRYLADASGAGDAFLGSLAYHIARFPNLEREYHIHAANICAAYSVGQRGTQPSFPGPELAQTDLCRQTPVFSLVPDQDPNTEEPRITISEPMVHPSEAAIASGIPVAEAKKAEDVQSRASDVEARKSQANTKRGKLSSRFSKSLNVPRGSDKRIPKLTYTEVPFEAIETNAASVESEPSYAKDPEPRKDSFKNRLTRTIGLGQLHNTTKIKAEPISASAESEPSKTKDPEPKKESLKNRLSRTIGLGQLNDTTKVKAETVVGSAALAESEPKDADPKKDSLKTRLSKTIGLGQLNDTTKGKAETIVGSAALEESETKSVKDAEPKKNSLKPQLSQNMSLGQSEETTKVMAKPVGGSYHVARSSVTQYSRHANVPYTHKRYVQKPKKKQTATKKAT